MWRECMARGGDACNQPSDRLSASLIWRGESNRPDRSGIPLFASSGGFIVSPYTARLLCAYADDGGSQDANCIPTDGDGPDCVAGCSHPHGYCSNATGSSSDSSDGASDSSEGGKGGDHGGGVPPWHRIDSYDRDCRCSIDWCRGYRPQPWRPTHLATMMRQFVAHGRLYRDGVYGMQSG